MYVGVTRARDYLVLTQPKGKRAGDTVWLSELMQSDSNEITLPDPDDDNPSIDIGNVRFQCRAGQYTAKTVFTRLNDLQQHWFIPPVRTGETHLPYTIVPSTYEREISGAAKIGEAIVIGERSRISANADRIRIGEAVHAFIAADKEEMGDQQRKTLAAEILSGWDVAGDLTAEQLIDFSDQLSGWIKQIWPTAIIRKEWPMRMRIGNQVAHGWIDMLLELPEGYVVIDHKSYAGDEPEKKAEEYAQQLITYKQAIEQSSGKPVIQSLIHMPLQGLTLPCL